MHNPRNPSQPPRQLALTNLQLRTNLVKTVLSIQILFQRFVVLMESDCFLRCSAFFALFVGEVVVRNAFRRVVFAVDIVVFVFFVSVGSVARVGVEGCTG